MLVRNFHSLTAEKKPHGALGKFHPVSHMTSSKGNMSEMKPEMAEPCNRQSQKMNRSHPIVFKSRK